MFAGMDGDLIAPALTPLRYVSAWFLSHTPVKAPLPPPPSGRPEQEQQAADMITIQDEIERLAALTVLRLLEPRFPAIGASTSHSSDGAACPRISRGLLPSQGTSLYFSVLIAFPICPLYNIRAYLAVPAKSAPVARAFFLRCGQRHQRQAHAPQ
jgi:hypothetical protein